MQAHPITAAQQVLAHLKMRGQQSAAQIARRLGVTAMAVRQHLYRLRDEGLVDYIDERRKVGRPARIWRLRPEAAEHFPDNHRELTLGFIEAAREVFGASGLARIVAQRSKRQLRDYRHRMPRTTAPLEKRVAALASIRTEQGYMAEHAKAKDGSFVLSENHCPVCAAASRCPQICGEELSLFRAAMGEGVRVEREEHILAGARRCAYRIAKSNAG